MPKATGEWIDAGSVRMPVMILTYEEEMDEVGPVWIARSILTGHIAAGTTEARAAEFLRRTVAYSIQVAAKHGKTFDQWFCEQRPAEPQLVEQYFRCAAEVGRAVDWTAHGRNAVAVAPA
jgi:hypothetical protein